MVAPRMDGQVFHRMPLIWNSFMMLVMISADVSGWGRNESTELVSASITPLNGFGGKVLT